MPRHNFDPLRGRLAALEITSEAAADNRLGDPGTRSCPVYLPPGYDEGDARYPLLVALAAYTGSGLKLMNWNSFDETLPQRVDRLIHGGEMPPCVVAMPDCFTSMGGNQYLNSPLLGRWEDFIYQDLVPSLEAEFHLLEGPAHRGVFGHSSGGYGALVHAMRHGDQWGAAACHSADMGFDMVYRPDLPKAVNALAAFEGSHEAFLEALQDSRKMRGNQFYALMILAMAASYDFREDEPMGIKLPVDLHTCELDEAAWGTLARARPPDDDSRSRPSSAAALPSGALHRLRISGRIPAALRRASTSLGVERGKDRAPLRRISRRPFQGCVPTRPQPSLHGESPQPCDRLSSKK